ncbi:MAG: hypothetical protein PHE50_05600 [Dehalococcoidales bacterium]|nr:hypothetical protein [Dehalococcoidales bacterium]
MPALVYLAQLGADGDDPRIRAGCEILLSRFIDSGGSVAGLSLINASSDFNYCAAGMMGAALIDLGWYHDQRLQIVMEWLAQAITGEGVAGDSNRDANKRHDKSGNSYTPFACSQRNANLPCAWGAIKAMIALSKIPPAQRTRNMHEAIRLGVGFLLSHDPAAADYPFATGNKPSSN